MPSTADRQMLLRESTKDMVRYAWDTVAHHVGHPKAATAPQAPKLAGNAAAGIFVSWEGSRGENRGCIGRLGEIPLPEGIRQFALFSSQEDDRFPTIKASHLPELTAKISILHTYEPGKHIRDFEIGKHGVTLTFTGASGRAMSSTFLPDVVPQVGSSHDEILAELILKAGLNTADIKSIEGGKVERYQSDVCAMTYAEWVGEE